MAPGASDRGGKPGDDTVPASTAPDDPLAALHDTPGDRYRLGVELGRGGMGRVVEAFDRRLGRTVALKEVLPKGGPGIARRFLREVQITARLEHQSIVPLYDSGTMPDGRPYYVMRRVSGRPLDELIGRARTLGERLAYLPNLLDAIAAIAHAHRRGVIHRDLKPANILVGDLGETVVIDWGLAKVVGEENDGDAGADALVPSAADSLKTQVGSVFGTPGFMPPEQARGEELGPRSDVFALGATLYQLLAGRPPVVGTSATEMIQATHEHRIQPVAELCPAAPPELVAIVDKALGHAPETRYPDADALAEDVRRFLTGQLVAAHQYTRRQRIGRFARRHRAPLSVAALALVAVAVLAWIGVHRVIEERDVAQRANEGAEQARRDLERTAANLADQRDVGIVLRARALVDSNPTQAIAALKQLDASSKHLAEAQAVAKSAVVRGVAYGVPTFEGLTASFELSPDGRLLHAVQPGGLEVVDLTSRRIVLRRTYALGSHATWLAGHRILVTNSRVPARLLDVATGTDKPFGPAMDEVYATALGDVVSFLDGDRHAQRLDVATGAIAPVGPGAVARQIRPAPDGSWFAVAARDRVTVYDRAGVEIFHHEIKDPLIQVGRTGHLAMYNTFEAWDIQPGAAHPQLTHIPPGLFVIAVFYRDDEMLVVSGDRLLGWDGHTITPRGTLPEGTITSVVGAWSVALLAASDSRLHFYGDDFHGSVEMPDIGKPPRVAARFGSTQIATVGLGVIYLWDGEAFLPRTLRGPPVPAVFVRETTLIQQGASPLEYHWTELPSGAATPIELPRLSALPAITWERDGRALLASIDPDKAYGDLIVLDAGGRAPYSITGVRYPLIARLASGDRLVLAADNGRVMVQQGDRPPSQLLALDGEVESFTLFGDHQIAALSDRGELVRARLDGSDLVRTRIHDQPSFLAGRGDHVLLVDKDRLLQWDGDIQPVATFTGAPIRELMAGAGGTVVIQEDNQATYLPDGSSDHHRIFPPGPAAPTGNADGTMFVSLGGNGQIELVELPSCARWTLPSEYTGNAMLAVSPSGTELLQGTLSGHELRRLPRPGGDFREWLDDLTNASEDADYRLDWPWTGRSPAP